jgi:hypothetical protein
MIRFGGQLHMIESRRKKKERERWQIHKIQNVHASNDLLEVFILSLGIQHFLFPSTHPRWHMRRDLWSLLPQVACPSERERNIQSWRLVHIFVECRTVKYHSRWNNTVWGGRLQFSRELCISCTPWSRHADPLWQSHLWSVRIKPW